MDRRNSHLLLDGTVSEKPKAKGVKSEKKYIGIEDLTKEAIRVLLFENGNLIQQPTRQLRLTRHIVFNFEKIGLFL